ncbi:TetR/AcrR family transcriptional regulator [Agrobacterium rhizogenes]|uniref:TetR/AcrR family transcriptional regulator n=1 Tax=Rhizobium rhizogenes TaxID=359 RepID=UPI001574B956|nr:TetR/AcrR family transcriptional regulator [Rhizobium rhizogenes]NTF87175.1 TetR/AcrR family transcriptional regulator [Rhizobium rhizogenes]
METHRTERGADRVKQLVESAAELFLEQGYDAVSIDMVISRSGGSRRNVYDHFGGKEGLFIEAVTRLCADISAPLELLEIPKTGEFDRALTSFACSVLGIVLQPQALALHRLMASKGHQFPRLAQAIWFGGPENATRILASWIAPKQTDGQFRANISAFDLAEQFLSMLVMAPQLRGLVGIDRKPLDQAAIARLSEAAVKTFLQGAITSEAKDRG